MSQYNCCCIYWMFLSGGWEEPSASMLARLVPVWCFVCLWFFGSFVCQIFYAVFISPSVAYWVQWMLSLFVLRFCLAWSHQHITLVCYFCSIRHHTSPHSFKKRMCETNNEDHFVKHCTAQLTILNDTHFLINTLCVCHIGSQWPLSLFGWIWFVCLHSCYL